MGVLFKLDFELQDREVIVFQMGKVASTAIVNSIQEYGLKASQPHFLSMDSFVTLLEKFSDPEMTSFTATNHLGQIQQNVIIHNKIQRQKKHHYRDKKGSSLLKVITLAREPIGWYLSNFSQNYPEYERDVEDWLKYSQISGSIEKTSNKQRILIEFINEVMQFFDQNVPEIEGNIIEIFDQRVQKTEGNIIQKLAACLDRVVHFFGERVQETGGNIVQKLATLLDKESAGYTPVHEVFVKHCIMLVRPICWFEQHFDPVMGTCFQKMHFNKNRGYSTFRKDGMDVLVIRFEDLAKIGQKVIGDFLEIEDFKMKRDNISEKKEVGAIISSSIKHLNFSRGFLEKIYNNSYCSKFYTEKHIDDFMKRYLGNS